MLSHQEKRTWLTLFRTCRCMHIKIIQSIIDILISFPAATAPREERGSVAAAAFRLPRAPPCREQRGECATTSRLPSCREEREQSRCLPAAASFVVPRAVRGRRSGSSVATFRPLLRCEESRGAPRRRLPAVTAPRAAGGARHHLPAAAAPRGAGAELLPPGRRLVLSPRREQHRGVRRRLPAVAALREARVVPSPSGCCRAACHAVIGAGKRCHSLPADTAAP